MPPLIPAQAYYTALLYLFIKYKYFEDRLLKRIHNPQREYLAQEIRKIRNSRSSINLRYLK